jgi:hypothetical protein
MPLELAQGIDTVNSSAGLFHLFGNKNCATTHGIITHFNGVGFFLSIDRCQSKLAIMNVTFKDFMNILDDAISHNRSEMYKTDDPDKEPFESRIKTYQKIKEYLLTRNLTMNVSPKLSSAHVILELDEEQTH